MFLVFPRTFLTIHCLPHFKPLLNSPCHSWRTSIFTSFQLKILKKKVWVFSFSLHTSCSESCLLEFVVVDLIWDICCFGDGLDECLLCLDFWVLLIKLLGFYWLSMSIDLFDVWISYPLCYDIFLVYCNALCVFFWLIQNGCV